MSSSEEHATYSVSRLTDEIRGLLEGKLAKIYVEGEISGWRVYPSGHAYFTLKDADAQISCVMFKGMLARSKARESLKDGAKVLVYANVSVYAPRGQYQLVVLAAKLAGVGDLMQQYLALKAKLESEGLFDIGRKLPLPYLPRRIGIVTSEAGAVIHDMCTVMARRFPAVQIRLFPALVQGATAPATLIAGLDYFDGPLGDLPLPPTDASWRPDLVIIARGGGSFEDLFCFNDEALVRRVAAMRVPTISAVGHETDFTLCDFAASKRAGTPSIAAEIAVPVLSELMDRIADARSRLVHRLHARGEFFAQRLDHLSETLSASLAMASVRARRRLDALALRIGPAVRLAQTRAEARLERATSALRHLSPYGVLDRGYALVTDPSGAVLRDAGAVGTGDRLSIRLAKGALSAKVIDA